jgi:hypothetical protein
MTREYCMGITAKLQSCGTKSASFGFKAEKTKAIHLKVNLERPGEARLHEAQKQKCGTSPVPSAIFGILVPTGAAIELRRAREDLLTVSSHGSQPNRTCSATITPRPLSSQCNRFLLKYSAILLHCWKTTGSLCKHVRWCVVHGHPS